MRSTMSHIKHEKNIARKSWFSLYNNSFPGKIKPSYRSAILIFTAFLTLGLLNTSDLNSIQSPTVPNTNISKRQETSPFIKSISIENKCIGSKRFNSPWAHFPKTRSTLVASYIRENNVRLETVSKKKDSKVSYLNIPEIHKRNQISNWVSFLPSTSKDFSFQVYASSSYNYDANDFNKSYRSIASLDEINNNGQKVFSIKKTSDIEAGGTLLFNLSKFVKIKAGMQLNYTNYEINDINEAKSMNNSATENYAAIENESVLINNEGNYTHKTSDQKINASSYQISIPIGGEVKIAKISNLEWYAGATVQPSFLIAGNDDLQNEQLKNSTDIGTIRTWNVNTNFETYLSYNLKNGIRLNAGPQLKYQMFPTLSSKYLYSEKLYNLGLKVGISKNL